MVFRLQPKMQTPECNSGRLSVIQCKETSLRKVAYQNHVSGSFQFPRTYLQRICPNCQTVNVNFYTDVLDCLIERINRICPDLHACGDWFLLHDNALTHNTASVRQFLDKKKCYSPSSPFLFAGFGSAVYFLFS